MNEQEAKEFPKDLIMTIKDLWELNHTQKKTIIKALEEIQQYRALGTVEELREAKHKQTPKLDFVAKIGKCPGCGNLDIAHRYKLQKYCGECGQRLDWSE